MNGLLFIDDEEGIRRSIVRALDKESYKVFTAVDGNTGIDVLKKNVSHISTVISDFRMPGIDGLQTLMAVYKLNPEITRIILTGYASVETAIEATNQGIDGFLTKPFDNMELRGKNPRHIGPKISPTVCSRVGISGDEQFGRHTEAEISRSLDTFFRYPRFHEDVSGYSTGDAGPLPE